MAGRIHAGILAGIAFLAFASAADARHGHKNRAGREEKALRWEFAAGKATRRGAQDSLFPQERIPSPNMSDVLQQLQSPEF